MRRIVAVLLFVGVAAGTGTWLALGCGCQQHGVSPVTVTPEQPCLELHAGVPGRSESSVGLCEAVWLLGRNDCAEDLHLPEMSSDGTLPALDVPPDTEFQFKVAENMTAGHTYTIDASLGSLPISISFRIGADEL